MAIQQTGTGYRDATKALSIKALQQRQKDAAANAAAAMAPQAEIASPWQGVGHIANILGSGFTQARAENAESDARARLAEIVAGIDPVKGATAEQQAQVRMLDEEFANRIYEEAAKARAREDEQLHATGLQKDQQTFTGGQNELERGVITRGQDIEHEEFGITSTETARSNAAREAQEKADYIETRRAAGVDEALAAAEFDEKKRAAGVTEGQSQAQIDETARANQADEAQERADYIETRRAAGVDEALAAAEFDEKKRAAGVTEGQSQAQIDETARANRADEASQAAVAARTAADPYSGTGDIEKDYNNGVFGLPGSERAIQLRDKAIAAENLKGTPSAAPGSKYNERAQIVAGERHDKIIQEGNATPAFISDIRRLGELGSQIGTGKEEQLVQMMGPWARAAGLDLEIFSNLDAGQAYDAIAAKMAPNMRPAGSGPTSNYDAEQFLKSLPSLYNTTEGNAIIEATFEALAQHRTEAAALASRSLLPETDPNYIPWNEVDTQIAALPYPFDTYNKYIEKSGGGGGAGEGGGSSSVDDPLGIR